MNRVDVAVIGGYFAGKTAIILRFIHGCYYEAYEPPLEVCQLRTIQIGNGVDVEIDLRDTRSMLEHSDVSMYSIENCKGFLCAYSVTDTRSFADLRDFISQVKQIRQNDNIPIVVIGNKCDLECERTVMTEEGLRFAEQHNAAFWETSAKFGINIHEAITYLAQEVVRQDAENLLGNKERKEKKCVVF